MNLFSFMPSFGIASLIFPLVCTVFYCYCYWRIFEKMGMEGWKSLIPFYNTYLQFSAVWSPTMGLIALGCIAVSVLCNMMAALLSVAFFSILGLMFAIGAIILMLICLFKLGKCFGGTAFGVGTLLVSFVFIPLIAFGNYSYMGY